MKDIAVIFDLDGVIFDSERACLASWREVAKKYYLENIDEVFRKCIGTNKYQTREIVEKEYAPKFGVGFSDTVLAEGSIIFHQNYDNGRLPLKKGVPEIFDFLKERNIPMAVASSTRRAVVCEELEAAGLLSYFEKIIGGDAVKISKPNPEIYLIACKEMNVQPQNAYAVEDSYNGVRAAHAAGMHALMVPDLIAPDDEMRSLSEYICEDLLELRSVFEQIL